MTAVTLPRLIEEKLEDLARQVRRLRLYRGLGRLVVLALTLALLGLYAERTYNTPTARWSITLAWLAAVVAGLWVFIIKPQRQLLTTSTLASAIETQFPSLSERLTTLVELSRSTDIPHGSKPLMDLLIRDTAQRTKRLDFERAAPLQSTLRIGLFAGLLLAVALMATLFVSGGSTQVKRFLLPWHTPRIDVPYAIKVSSGSVAIKRGEAITLTAYLERLTPDAVLPANAVALVREAGVEKKLPMTGDDQAAFHVTRPSIAATFDYRIEAGPLMSEWYTVTVADPVELGEGSSITITPPAYATPPLAKTTVPGFAPFDGLQYSTIEMKFQFTRPAVSAALQWQSNSAGTVENERIRLVLAEDRRSATASTNLVTAGNFRLALTGEHDSTSVTTVAAQVRADTPPRFEKALGLSERPRQVRPEESIILEALAVDDLRIDALVLEFAINGGKMQEVPLKLKEPNTARGEAKYVWNLSQHAKMNDAVTYRLRATDSRKLPGLPPQSTYYPEKAWATIALSPTAESLDQQDVLSQRDSINQKLAEAAAEANEARKVVDALVRDLGEKPMLTTAQVGRLHEARTHAGKASDALEEAAKDAALTPELRGFADAVRSVAQETVRAADDLLRRSENEASPKKRNEDIVEAGVKLTAARERIEQLQKQNEELARNRLDKRKLEKLADDVNKLATEPPMADELARKLQRAKDELRELINGNEALKKGAEDAAQQKARELADEAARLKAEQEKLDRDIAASEAKARQAALAENAKAQDALNEQVDELRKRTATPSRLTGDEPLAKPPFDDAKQKLDEGDNVGAMTEQEKAARELERLAEGLEKAATERADPQLAARQLAKLQADLAERLQRDSKDKPLSDAQKEAFTRQQQAIRKAAEKITTPPAHRPSETAKADVLAKLQAAEESLAKGEPSQEQAEAAAALKSLADALPPREQRLKEAKTQLDKLIREQDAIARTLEDKLKPYERRNPDDVLQREAAEKLQSLMKQQAELAGKIDTVDAPGLESRRERTANAAHHAADDLRDGLTQDIPASQGNLRRQMAQLRTALDGATPADAQADELAKKQKRLSDDLQKPNADAATLGAKQREIADALKGMTAPEASDRLQRARQAADDAAKQFKQADDVEQLRRKAQQAAKNLDELAEQLAGSEGDRERVERLTRQREAQAESSKVNAGKPTPPEQAAAAQGELERELDDLKRTRSGPAQAEKKQAQDALERLRRTPNAERAPALQKAAAEALDQLAKKMKADPAKQPRQTGDCDCSGDAGGNLPSKADAAQARDLAQKQRELRDGTGKAAGGAKPDAAEAAGQAQEQQAMNQKAGELAKALDAAAHAPTNKGDAADALTKAAEAAKQAQEQMSKAAREAGAGHAPGAHEARGEAVKSLEQAKAKASAAAGNASGPPDAKTAAASRAAKQANDHLREGELKQAAEKLGDAADKLGEAGQNAKGNDPSGKENSSKPLAVDELPPDLKHYSGKPWGDLPGDVKTRIIQDLKAKYGEDYARVIKLYFEQLAEKK